MKFWQFCNTNFCTVEAPAKTVLIIFKSRPT